MQHNVIMLMITLIVEIYFIDPKLEDNNVTITNGAIHNECLKMCENKRAI